MAHRPDVAHSFERWIDLEGWVKNFRDIGGYETGINAYLDSIGTTASVRRAVRANLLVPRIVTRPTVNWTLYP